MASIINALYAQYKSCAKKFSLELIMLINIEKGWEEDEEEKKVYFMNLCFLRLSSIWSYYGYYGINWLCSLFLQQII